MVKREGGEEEMLFIDLTKAEYERNREGEVVGIKKKGKVWVNMDMVESIERDEVKVKRGGSIMKVGDGEIHVAEAAWEVIQMVGKMIEGEYGGYRD